MRAMHSGGSTSGVRVPMPLCLRQAEHEAEFEDVLNWRSRVQVQISAVGDAFETLDGGPSKSELLVRKERKDLL